MADELKHKSQGTSLTQAEYENIDAHVFDGQATGDSVEASSVTQLSRRKNNISASTAPGVTDDTSAGYKVGSMWLDLTADKAYICLDVSAGAAVWMEITQAAYTDAEAISAIEGEATVDLTGDVTIAGTKSLKVDVIDEKDAGAGVTIDGLLVKDSGINASGVSAGTLAHERGGLEADVSAITTGGILRGSGAGAVGILAAFLTAGDKVKHEMGGLEADVSAGDGYVEVKGGATTVRKSNLAATVAPGASDDSASGYSVGSIWIDTTADKAYICLDVSAGAAVWTGITQVVGSAALLVESGSESKLTALTALAVGPVETDEVYISDGGTSKRVDVGELLNPENFAELAAGPADSDEVTINDGGTVKKITAANLLNPENFTALSAVPADTDEVFINDGGVGKKIAWSNLVPDASATQPGKSELATVAEIDTGTDAARTITPDGLAGSVHGEKGFQVVVFERGTDVATGDGKADIHIPSPYNGMNLVEVHAEVITAGTTGTTDIQIANATQAADMLSTKLTIDSGETGSDTAATPAVIDGANDDVATNDMLRVDVDAHSTTAPKGLILTLIFRLP